MATITLLLTDATATRSVGVTLGKFLPSGSVILLKGELGSGKTTLVQGMGEGLGITEPIVSPTFTLINEYTEGRLPLYHLDLYRLKLEEVADLHPEIYWEGIEVPLGIVAIEWSERLPYLPSNYTSVCLSYQCDGSRRVDFFYVEEFQLECINELLKN